MPKTRVYCLAATAFLAAGGISAAPAEVAQGVVYHDKNQNRQLDETDAPLPGVRVSNGVEIAHTDGQGRYELPVDDDTTIFVIKPRGYRTPFNEHNLPQFYYTHKPDGSPESKHPGVEPTGPLPDSINFPLYPQDEPDQFRAVLWADPQPRNLKEIEYITHDVIEELIGVDASFGVTLGDIMFDDLSLFGELNARVALIGIPWYNVIGNHDLNFEAARDKHSDETFERIYGPNYYSFDYGEAHFIVMDTVRWFIPEGEDRGKYEGGIGEDQIQFIENDLEDVPEDKLLVLMMHIPLTTNRFVDEERERLLDLIEERPFTLSLSGHTHYQQHVYLDEDDGWGGQGPHHHVINVTVSGSWWNGAPDELGIPHTTMRDGAPNGYSILTVDGTDYEIDFKAARRSADYQMNIYTPEEIDAAEASETEVIVNVFGGSKKSTVEMKFGETGDWVSMQQFTGKAPYFLELKQAEESKNPPRGRDLPNARKTPHLWKATLPSGPEPGAHTIQVRTTDQFGQTHRGERVIIVR